MEETKNKKNNRKSQKYRKQLENCGVSPEERIKRLCGNDLWKRRGLVDITTHLGGHISPKQFWAQVDVFKPNEPNIETSIL